MLTMDSLLINNADAIKSHVVRCLDIRRIFSVLEMKSGSIYIETQDIDEDGIETIELLFSTDRKHFQIVSRRRTGDDYNSMRSYDRDAKYPLYSTVVL